MIQDHATRRIRRIAIAATLAALVATSAGADVPRLMHYQGMLLTPVGAFATGPVSLHVRLYGHAANPTPLLFDEIHPAVTLEKGLFSIVIGSLTGGGVPDSAVDSSELWLGVSVNGDPELSPRIRVATTPYTLKARSTEQLVREGTVTPAVTVDAGGSVDVAGDGTTVRAPRKSTAGDPASGADGMIYYNEDARKFRVMEDGAWEDMRSGGSAGADPCQAPSNPWTFLGAINSDTGSIGEFGAIDISDATKEYLLWGTSTTGDFNINVTNPPISSSFVSPEEAPRSLYQVIRLQDEGGTWRSNQISDTTASAFVHKASEFEASSPTINIHSASISSYGSARVWSDGFVRLNDTSSTFDVAVAVFQRVPAGPTGEACDPTPNPWTVTGTANSDVYSTGDFGNIDIRDNAKEYLFWGTSTNSEFNLGSTPPTTAIRVSTLGDLANGGTTAPATTYIRRFRDDGGTWRSLNFSNPPYLNRIQAGADWDPAPPSTAIATESVSSYGSIRVFSDGFIRLTDSSSTFDLSAVVLQRVPLAP